MLNKKVIIFCLAVFFVLLMSLSIAAQESSVGSPEETRVVTSIEIKGNKSISTSTILSKLKLRLGQTYSSQIIKGDIKRLYSLGFFSDIKTETLSFKDGFKVIFYVTEQPVIVEIIFEGGRSIGRYTLKKAMKTKTDNFLDHTKLKNDIREITKIYQRRGFSDVKIESKLDIDSQTNKAKVTILIDEGRTLKVNQIQILGNKSFGYKQLLKLMKTRRPFIWPLTIFRKGFFKPDILKEDLDKIKAFYRQNGFLDIELGHKINYIKPERVNITININEGTRYIVGNIYIQGNQAIKEDRIRDELSACTPGKIFSQEVLVEDLSSIQGLYFDRGYIFAVVKESTSLDPQTGNVNITYRIREKEKGYVEMVKIRGNVKTKDLVIRRELRLLPGEVFSGEKLRRSRQRLNNLGFFEEVNFDTEPGTSPNKRNLIVEVKESKTGEFMFGGGYSSIDEFVGFVQVEQKNFDWKNFPYFTGDGQNLRFRFETGTVREELYLSFTEPWIFDYPLSFGFDLYSKSHDRETDVGYAFDESRKGGDIHLGKELSEYLRARLFLRLDNIEITDIAPDVSNEIKKEEGENTIISLEFGLTRDTRDNVFEPTAGRVLNSSLELAGGPLGGDKDFTKFTGGFSNYLAVFKKSVLESKIRVGFVDAFGDSDYVPIYERFYAGGAYTIRGYRERKVGPVDVASNDPIGGESMLVANLEYQYPLVEFIKGVAFFDVGNVWSKVNDFGSGGYKSSIGLGARIKTPIGPIKLDYGYPLNKEPGEEEREGRFHFSMSHGF